MKTITRLFHSQIAAGNIDAWLLRTAQIVCFAVAAFVFVAGLLKVARLDLAEAQFFGAVQQVAQTALLFCVVGLLLHPKRQSA